MKTKETKAITLISLVVTIVVLLILAGVSINLVLGDNGIIKKAKEAKDETEKVSQNSMIELNELSQELENKINSNNGENDRKQNTKVTYPDGDVWIPEGFEISDDSASTVKDGVIIEDKDKNQFVWIPVESISNYKRIWYTGYQSLSYYSEELPNDEQTSIEYYKGYYIGRYEAGDKESTTEKTYRSSNDVSKTVTIKANQVPYNYVTPIQAKSLSENFGTQQGYKAKTKLVSSYAWDTAIEFMQNSVSDYGSSSSQGNYYDTKFNYTDITAKENEENIKTKAEKSGTSVTTGQTTAVCNIYDMGGNVWEWTTESFSSTKNPYSGRGGGYYYNYALAPVGSRNDYPGIASDDVGFRITLFL